MQFAGFSRHHSRAKGPLPRRGLYPSIEPDAFDTLEVDDGHTPPALPPAEREDVLARSGPQLARYARFSPAVLRRLVDQTRARGYSFVAGTIIPGMSAFGVPVLDPDGHALAALSVAAIDARMTSSRRAKLVRLVQAQAAALAARLSSGRRRAPTGASSTEVKGQRRRA